jgi:hypothetical protein
MDPEICAAGGDLHGRACAGGGSHSPDAGLRTQHGDSLGDIREGIPRFDENIGPNGDPQYPMGSESELTRRLARGGYKAWHCPGAVVDHIIRPSQLTRGSMLQRATRYGRGQYRLRQDLQAQGTACLRDRGAGPSARFKSPQPLLPATLSSRLPAARRPQARYAPVRPPASSYLH